MNDENKLLQPSSDPNAMNLLISLQERQRLLDTLTQRIDLQQEKQEQQLQEWIRTLKQQQLNDLNMYKTHLFNSRLPQQIGQNGCSLDEEVKDLVEKNHWQSKFADGFIGHLDDCNSYLIDLWLKKKYNYPAYIGFDISRSRDDFDFYADNAYWIAVSLRQKRVFVGVYFRDPLYFQHLEAEKHQINSDFLFAYGRPLEWGPTTGNDPIYRIYLLIGIYSGNNQQTLYHELCKVLEKMDEMFEQRLDEIYQKSYARDSRQYEEKGFVGALSE